MNFFLVILALNTVTTSSENVCIRNGDRIVFYGDSITQQRLYTSFLEAYLTGRFPNYDLTFRNAGWGGDTAEGANKRLERDVLDLKPNLVTVDFGMNDGKYQGPDPTRIASYSLYQEKLIIALKATGVKTIMLSPNAVDTRYPMHRTKLPDYPPTLHKMTMDLMALSAKHDVPAVDMFSPMADALRRLKHRGSNKTVIPDGVHPDISGHLVMAYAVLSSLGAPGQVAKMSVDACTGSVSAEDTVVSNVKTGDDNITFTALDSGLPMYVPETADTGLKVVPVQRRLNRHILKVTNLQPGMYELCIDGKSIYTMDNSELADGINLSNLQTPMWEHAGRLWDLIIEKNDIYFSRWREVQLFNEPTWLKGEELEALRDRAIKGMDAQISDLETKISLEKKPIAHTFEIKKVK